MNHYHVPLASVIFASIIHLTWMEKCPIGNFSPQSDETRALGNVNYSYSAK